MTGTHTRNILKVFRAASDAHIAEGMAWYSNAHSIAREIAPDNIWLGAGLLAAYSPLTPWDRNVELAQWSAANGFARTDTLPNNYMAAHRMLEGEPVLDVLQGLKTRHFAENIALCGNTDKVTIDSIAYSVAHNRHYPAKAIKGFGKRVYADISKSYQNAARMVDLRQSDIQAITWVLWRENKGI